MPMECNALIDPALSGICNQARALSGIRLTMFLEWLTPHRHTLNPEGPSAEEIASRDWAQVEVHLRAVLGTWFVSLSLPGLLWEYHLVLTEIGYWREIGPQQLEGVLEAERKR